MELFDLSYKFEVDDDPPEISNTRRVNEATSSNANKLPPGYIQKVVSKSSNRLVNK
jgi:hypothetical protein